MVKVVVKALPNVETEEAGAREAARATGRSSAPTAVVLTPQMRAASPSLPSQTDLA